MSDQSISSSSEHNLRRLRSITMALNAEGVQSPQPQKGRVSRSWCPSSVRTILHNDRYRGVVIWGKTKKVRSPKTCRRVYKARPQASWVRTGIPEQQIVSDELWQRVRARLAIVKNVYARKWRAAGRNDEFRLPLQRTIKMLCVRGKSDHPMEQGTE
jgi:hypothetical protein